MDFRTYGRDYDLSDILFFAFMAICGFLLLFVVYAGWQEGQQERKEHKEFKAKCIDAGGAPVAPFDYIKDHGEGYLCINPSAIIEVN